LSEPIYAIHDLQHGYAGRPALDIPHLVLEPHAIVGLVGPNGSGKSTLMRLLAAVETPRRGRVYFEGAPLAPFSPATRSRITLLSQEPYLLRRSVQRNVAYGLELRGRPPELRERVAEALNLVGLPPERFAPRSWRALSGGEAQRVALAARLALHPTVLLLDEPTASVDAHSAELIKAAALRARREWGTTLVIASHDRPWLQIVCDTVMQLCNGRILKAGRESLVFGPWRRRPDGRAEKILPDGQRLVVPAPLTDDAVLLFQPALSHAAAPPEGDPTGQARLQGTVLGLNLDKGDDGLTVTCQAAGLTVHLHLGRDQVEAERLLPGRPVVLTYRQEDLQWL
jgi:tungstate transport system ATP-binding protein